MRSGNGETKSRLIGAVIALIAGALMGGPAVAQDNFGKLATDAMERGDYDDAAKWYSMMAEQGFPNAQNNLANLYIQGKGVEQSYVQAAKWYRAAAELGLADAQYNLGVLYHDGNGLAQDYGEALNWWLLAAQQGDAWAQFNIGVLYERGRGVGTDKVQAYLWYTSAAKQGLQPAFENRSNIVKQMTPRQIADAKRLSSEWKPVGER